MNKTHEKINQKKNSFSPSKKRLEISVNTFKSEFPPFPGRCVIFFLFLETKFPRNMAREKVSDLENYT